MEWLEKHPDLAGSRSYSEFLTHVLAELVAPAWDWEEFVDPSWDAPAIADALGLEEELASALVYAIRIVYPIEARHSLVRRFFREREPRAVAPAWRDYPFFGSRELTLRVAARAALGVLDLSESGELSSPRVRDLLQGAAQGDKGVDAPEAWHWAALSAAAARRERPHTRDAAPTERSEAAARTAVGEALDPRHGDIYLHDIVLNAVRAIGLETLDADRLADFLLDLDRAFAEAAAEE